MPRHLHSIPRMQPTDGVARFAAGTPGVLSLSALDAALFVFEGVDMRVLAGKAQALGELVIARAEAMGLERSRRPMVRRAVGM